MDTELHVGREMDAAVAKALGWEHAFTGISEMTEVWVSGADIKTIEARVLKFAPSTSIADAFAALDAVLVKHAEWDPELIRSWYKSVRQWECALAKQGETVAWGRGATPAEAICRAILALEARNGH